METFNGLPFQRQYFTDLDLFRDFINSELINVLDLSLISEYMIEVRYREKIPALQQTCMILDLDGYQVNHQPFIVREIGIYSIPKGSFSWSVENTLPYSSLEKKDRKRVNYVYHHVHGLRFQSSPEEKAIPQHVVKAMIQASFQRSKSQDQFFVGYRGGTLESDLLKELNIPSLNLKDFGCPKSSQLKLRGFIPGCSCGNHLKPELHCVKQETFLLYQWLDEYV